MSLVENKVQVLIIEDSPDDCYMYKRHLKSIPNREFDFEVADTGVGGIVLFSSGRDWDIVILDYSIPDMNGLEILQQLRIDPSFQFTPVVMVTGQGSENIAVEAMKHGAFDYLIKGDISQPALARVVTNALAKRALDLRVLKEAAMRSAAEEELRQFQLRTSELETIHRTVATLAHEINNPLTGVIANLQMISEQHIDAKERSEMLAESLLAAQRIRDVVDKLSQIKDPEYRPYFEHGEIIDLRDDE